LASRGAADDTKDQGLFLTEHVRSSVMHVTHGLRTVSAGVDLATSGNHSTSKLVRTQLDLQLETLLAGGVVPSKLFDLVINAGSTIYAPPYDHEWNIGSGLAFGAKADGKFLTVQPKAGETSGAGVGLILQSPSLLDASIRPQGTYKASVLSVENQPPGSWSAGGLGLTIYKGTNQAPEISRIATLWSVANMAQWSGENLEGLIADATSLSPVGLWFPYRLTDFTLRMEPNIPYLVWVWTWQTDNVPENTGFLAMMSVTMPAVSLVAGPPVVIG